MATQPNLVVGNPEFKAKRLTLILAGAGLVGGILGFLLGEIQMTGDDTNRFFQGGSDFDLYAGTALYMALVMVGIGLALVASQALIEGNMQKWGVTMPLAVPASLIGGALAGLIAETAFQQFVSEERVWEALDQCIRRSSERCWDLAAAFRPARTIAWIIAGGLGGAALGFAFKSKKRVQNGLMGGAAGGLVGGLLFDVILIGTQGDTARLARFIALLVIGGLMGALIGLVDTLRTEMWITVASGEMTGRQFILYDESTIVGCARNVPVTILADRTVAEHHIRIDRTGAGTSFECMHNAPPVIVNGNQTTSGRLANGDVIKIGNTELQIGERKTSAPSPGQTPTTPTAPSSTGRPDIYSDQPASPPPQPQKPIASAPRQRPTIQMKPKEDG